MRIVVVEDEAPIRNGMSKILQKIDDNYEVVGTAGDGTEGLKLLEEADPDLVILDIHMPDMDGLTMLAKARQEGINCKAIVLTAYSDFVYAKMAIEIGIENYLLKPIKIPELKRALRQVENSLVEEESKGQFFSLENIFLRSVTGRFPGDKQTEKLLWDQYGISMEEEIAVFVTKLGDSYELCHDVVRALLEETDVHSNAFSAGFVELEEESIVIMLLYHMKNQQELQQYFEKSVLPMLCGQVKGSLICVWKECKGLTEVSQVLREAREDMEWNLTFGRGVLISQATIADANPVPLKYLAEIENQAKQAVRQNEETAFAACTKRLQEHCRMQVHDPREIKETVVRYVMEMFHTAKESGKVTEEISTQDIMNRITGATAWTDLDGALQELFARLHFWEDDDDASLMVQRARQMIREYYNQGITLEEIARNLRVSEEYLSAQFKKETGKTFTETIRGYRIDKVKELLLKSTLKLNQIADMAGYADPKYMSKVFKEETGITPAEYRKLNN